MRPRVDDEITASRVFLVDAYGTAIGECERDQAIERARNAGLRLVEVQPEVALPVCKLMAPDRAARFIERVREPREQLLETRVLTFRATMREADIALRLRHAVAHLEDGGAVEIRVERRGRHDRAARELIERIITALGEIGRTIAKQRNTNDEIVALVYPRNGSPGTYAK